MRLSLLCFVILSFVGASRNETGNRDVGIMDKDEFYEACKKGNGDLLMKYLDSPAFSDVNYHPEGKPHCLIHLADHGDFHDVAKKLVDHAAFNLQAVKDSYGYALIGDILLPMLYDHWIYGVRLTGSSLGTPKLWRRFNKILSKTSDFVLKVKVLRVCLHMIWAHREVLENCPLIEKYLNWINWFTNDQCSFDDVVIESQEDRLLFASLCIFSNWENNPVYALRPYRVLPVHIENDIASEPIGKLFKELKPADEERTSRRPRADNRVILYGLLLAIDDNMDSDLALRVYFMNRFLGDSSIADLYCDLATHNQKQLAMGLPKLEAKSIPEFEGQLQACLQAGWNEACIPLMVLEITSMHICVDMAAENTNIETVDAILDRFQIESDPVQFYRRVLRSAALNLLS